MAISFFIAHIHSTGDKMKKFSILMLCILMQIGIVHADSYCVMIGSDNTIVEEKDMHKQQSVASISKIMTAILAIEQGDLDEHWNTSDAILTAVGSSIYLKEGQDVSLRSLLYGLMLRSGNDAAIEIAVHISGSEAEFVQKMNEKAKEIGMLNTIFENPSGLDEEGNGNLSTAYDMAILMSYAMKNPQFKEITGSQYYTTEWNWRWKNKNKLLFEFPFATGGKTGYTKHAGRTLVTTAENNGTDSIVVTLQTPDDFKFHEEKHKEVFEEMEVIELLKEGTFTTNQCVVTVDVPVKMSIEKDGSDKIKAYTHIDGGEFILEVQKNDESYVYKYPAESIKKSWWGRLFT